MAVDVAALLDSAKVIHRLPSDYKLALVLGVSHGSLTSYRTGKTLPDARVISKVCELTGDDAALILAEVEEQRATTTEARALWHLMAVRLQQAAAAGVFSVAALVGLGAGFPSGEAHAAPLAHQVNGLYIVEHRPPRNHRRRSRFSSWIAPAVRMLSRFFAGSYRVPCAASTAAA